MPELEYLQSLESRLVAAQLLAGGSAAWGAIRRLREDVRREIDALVTERDRWAEENCQESQACGRMEAVPQSQ